MELETQYSLRCLLNAQSGLRSTAAELAKLRRRLDKMLREKGMETARPVHDSIVRGKEKLCSLLNGSRLSLLEIGQEELASASQKLVCSVRHFPIMAPDYTPMLTGVLKFADLLPIKDDSLSAALGHLANLAKIGYYPTDPAHVAYLSQALVFPENSKINLLDPCCGEGLALERIAQGQNCHTFGVELDDSRARQACEHLERVAMGSYFYSRISHNAFQLLYEAAPENVNSMRHLECSMDDTYEAAESALACYCDLISPHDYGDNSECFTYGCYYSSKHMMEFYRLCRVHAKLLRVKLHEEPFFARAKRFV